MEVQRVEKHVLKPSSKYYKFFLEQCHLSKNLYNHANYIIRKNFIDNNVWTRYNELDLLLKSDSVYPDYKEMITAQSAQQVLKILDKNWKSFFKSIKDWSKEKGKYTGKPKLPKYKKKDGYNILIFTNQNCKIKDNKILFPKKANGFYLKTKVENNKLCQVRFIPKCGYISIEVVYKKEITDTKLANNNYIAIDLGIDNLAAITNNIGLQPIIINGKGLKSMNKYYNKLLAKYKSCAKICNNKDSTKRIQKIYSKRNFIIEDYMHKISRFIVEYAKENNISTIIIGLNKFWKNKSNMNKVTNQTFIQIPFNSLITKIMYKAEEFGITVITNNESYTSGTSFLDNEPVHPAYYNKKRRINRGLFISNSGIKINSDINGSLQIMKNVFPDAFKNCQGIKGLVLNPLKINI